MGILLTILSSVAVLLAAAAVASIGWDAGGN